MSRALMLSAFLALCATLAIADDKKEEKGDKTKDGKVTVEAAELSVSRKLDNKQFTYFGFSDRTTVKLLVTVPGKALLAVDPDSPITSFQDDKGNSLLPNATFFKPKFDQYGGQLSNDLKSMLVSYSGADKRPGKGATKVTLKGGLVLIAGADEKTTEAKKFEFAEKGEAKMGDLTLKVTSVFKGFNGGADTVNCSIQGPNPVRKITVTDGDGKAIEVQSYPPSHFNKEWSKGFSLKKPAKEAKVTITYFTKEEKVKVPVDLAIDLGL